MWSRPPIISCQLKGVPATLPSPPTFPLPRGGPADDTGESTAGAASRCALRHPSLKQPAARTSGPPPLLLPSCNPSSPSGVREGFFFDGLVTVLWLIALRPKLAAGGPRQRLNKEGQKGRRRGEELKGYKMSKAQVGGGGEALKTNPNCCFIALTWHRVNLISPFTTANIHKNEMLNVHFAISVIE